jgi:hypothetical protein
MIENSEGRMISQVLNRDFVLQKLGAVRAMLEEGAAEEGRRDGAPAGELGPLEGSAAELQHGDWEEALAAVRAAGLQEAVATSGQQAFDLPLEGFAGRGEPPGEGAERRGEELAPPKPLDDASFFSRDAVISNLQAALEQFYDRQPGAVAEPEPADDDRRGASAEVATTARTLKDVEPTRDLDDRRLFDRFSVTDIRWVSSALAMGIRRFRKRYPFKDQAAAPVRIGDSARVLLVGDWGTGLPRAAKVARQMRLVLDQGKAEGREQHVVHLGDVYYSGWQYEYERRFLPLWPVRPEEAAAISSWTCNGNHDMYAGGHAFFGTALADPRFARHQGSSYFSLHSSHWQILGLDTSWEDHGLAGSQAAWAKSVLTAPENAGKKGLLLSHHQVVSAFEGGGKSILREKIQPVLATGRVDGWIWGHEHRCMVYRPGVERIGFACCLGHGGVPVYMPRTDADPLPEPATYEFRDSFVKGLETWALFGFAVLELNGPEIAVRYIDENGREHHHERIV